MRKQVLLTRLDATAEVFFVSVHRYVQIPSFAFPNSIFFAYIKSFLSEMEPESVRNVRNQVPHLIPSSSRLLPQLSRLISAAAPAITLHDIRTATQYIARPPPVSPSAMIVSLTHDAVRNFTMNGIVPDRGGRMAEPRSQQSQRGNGFSQFTEREAGGYFLSFIRVLWTADFGA